MLVCWRTNYTESCSIFNFCWDYGKVDGIFLTDSSKACNTSTQAHFFHFLICILDSQSSCVVGSWLPRLRNDSQISTTLKHSTPEFGWHLNFDLWQFTFRPGNFWWSEIGHNIPFFQFSSKLCWNSHMYDSFFCFWQHFAYNFFIQ